MTAFDPGRTSGAAIPTSAHQRGADFLCVERSEGEDLTLETNDGRRYLRRPFAFGSLRNTTKRECQPADERQLSGGTDLISYKLVTDPVRFVVLFLRGYGDFIERRAGNLVHGWGGVGHEYS